MASDLATKETPEATATPEFIRSLRLKNYRGFRDYRLSDLRRVNLLVGDNNSGKTAILEAVYLLASGGEMTAFSQVSKQRGELAYEINEVNPQRPKPRVELSHFFYKHRFEPGTFFRISTNKGHERLSVHVVPGRKPIGEVKNPQLIADRPPATSAFKFAIKLKHLYHESTDVIRGHAWGMPAHTKEGATLFLERRIGIHPPITTESYVPVLFVSQDSLDRDSLAEMWDAVQMEGKEHEVVEALHILDDKVNRIIFLVGEGHRGEARGGIMLGYERMRRAVPLGSQGEGMRRMLGLALALVSCQNGILLIDEIDTGLHYSIMGDVWRLVAETAERLNVQVFATTHSFDCLRGLAWLCANHPDLGEEVSLQKIVPSLSQAVAFDAREIQNIVEQGTEVR